MNTQQSSLADASVSPLPVHFFIIPTGVTLERVSTLDPDREWTDMRRAKERWVVQTYLRLRKLGFPVTLGSHVPLRGLVVYHKEDQKALLQLMPRGARPILVAARADFRSADVADIEILQNGYYADDERRIFLPLWPQPGLIARDIARGTTVQNISFKGSVDNLIPQLKSDDFRAFLSQHAMRMHLDVVVDRNEKHPVHAPWHDFSTTDVVLALRPSGGRDHTHKPATKLYNAWLAGVPAVLSPDYAFRELRRGPLDYLEVTTVDEAKAALLRLQREPQLYRDMVENGHARAKDFSVEAITQRWIDLLYKKLPAQVRDPGAWRYAKMPRRVRSTLRKLEHALSRSRK